jgi:hypothetical protein
MKERRRLSSYEIIDLYKKGERDFSNVECTGNDFISIDLSGINFSGSNLEYSGFEESNLTGANFTNCNLQWSSFRHSNLTKANFTGADLSYSVLNDAIFENTILRKADLSWALMFNVNLHAADITDANIATIATHPSQITETGSSIVQERLLRMKHKLPYDLWLVLKSSVNKHMYEAQKAQRLNLSEVRPYELGKVGYGSHTGGDTPSEHVYLGGNLTYGLRGNTYKKNSGYTK